MAGALLHVGGGREELLPLLLPQEVAKCLDVFHGMLEDLHLAQPLQPGGPGHVLPQGVEPPVHALHPVPLPRVPLAGLQLLLGPDHVAMDGVERHRLTAARHQNYVCAARRSERD